jgi:hypothetical protein
MHTCAGAKPRKPPTCGSSRGVADAAASRSWGRRGGRRAPRTSWQIFSSSGSRFSQKCRRGEEAAIDGEAGFPIALFDTVTDLSKYLAERGAGLDLAGLVARVASRDVKGILQGVLGGGAVPEPVYCKAFEQRTELQRIYARHSTTTELRRSSSPLRLRRPLRSARTFMFNGKAAPTFATFIRNTDPGSVAGIPGISLPAGMTAAGLPVALNSTAPKATIIHYCQSLRPSSRFCPSYHRPQGRFEPSRRDACLSQAFDQSLKICRVSVR